MTGVHPVFNRKYVMIQQYRTVDFYIRCFQVDELSLDRALGLLIFLLPALHKAPRWDQQKYGTISMRHTPSNF